MDIMKYFENVEGTGILGTADEKGAVDMAIYARPHVMGEKTIAFIMAERLSYLNLLTNPQAAYMFIEKGPGYKGYRFYLSKVREETDPEIINAMRRKCREDDAVTGKRFLVYFEVQRVRPLIGDAADSI